MIQLKKNGYEVFPIIVPDVSSLKSINFYLYKNENSLTLVDAGLDTDICWNALQRTLSENGLNVKDVTQILLTHHHIDHVGLVNRMISEHSIPVYAHPMSIPRLMRDEEFLMMRIEFFYKLYQEMGCGEQGEIQIAFLKKAIQKNKTKKIEYTICKIEENQLFDFECITVPGHAVDQVAFFHKECNWLFAGDLLLKHISSNALVEPDGNGSRKMTVIEHFHSLKKGLALNARLVFPGHGQLIDDPESLFRLRINGIEKKANRFLALIKSGIRTAAEIAQTSYKETYLQQFSLVMSEVIGHLDYLEMQGKVRKEIINGVWNYSIL